MPYKVFEDNGEYCVYKLDESGNKTGSSLGCHSTKAEAEKQSAAIYANEKKEVDMENSEDKGFSWGEEVKGKIVSDAENKDETKELYANGWNGEVYDTDEAVPMGVTSFEEYDAAVEAKKTATQAKKDANVFSRIIDNILYNDEIQNPGDAIRMAAGEFASRIGKSKNKEVNEEKAEKPMKTEGGVKYPASDFAYVPDASKPSTWKLRLAEGKPGNITVAQLGRAAAAFSSGGFRGNKVSIPSSAAAGVKRKIRAAYKKLGVKDDEIPDSIKSTTHQFMVFKAEDGSMRFFTTYSNNRRDMDNPPEIIASQSHERFEKMIDDGEAEYPELWLWHTPSLKIGKTDFIAYDKDNGIAMAAGYFFKEAEFVAEAIADNPDYWGVSHGMPASTVKRSKEDPTVIIEHVTKEISPLPFQAAANKWADFTVLKEVNMTLAQEKKARLEELGVDGEMLTEIEEKNKSLNENLNKLGIESKETSEDAVADEEKEATEEQEPETKEDKEAEAQPVFSKEQTDQLAEAFNKMADQIVKKLDERLAPIEEQLSEKKSVEEAAEELVKSTPMLSLVDQIFPPSVLKQQSATKADDTVIDGRSKLGQDGPAETKEEKPTIVKTGSNFIDSLLTDIVTPAQEE